MTYNIKTDKGSESVTAMPQEGAWYCHFMTVTDTKGETFDSSGQLAQWVDGEFIDEEGEPVSMVHDFYPDYIIKQV